LPGEILHVNDAHDDLLPADRRRSLDHGAQSPLSIFVSAIGGK
jgi:hypothetical protein